MPIFFAQAANDFNTEPSHVLAGVMDQEGKPHALRIFPPHGATHRAGHGDFCLHGMAEWGPDVLAFLRAPATAKQR